MKKKYVVWLDKAERIELESIVSRLSGSSQKVRRANILCMDEQPVQLTKEVKPPIAATMSHPRRVDYEYERAGVTNVFMLAEPLAGWREVSVRSTKTKIDFAQAPKPYEHLSLFLVSSMTAPREPRQPAASVLGGLRQGELLTRTEPITSMGG